MWHGSNARLLLRTPRSSEYINHDVLQDELVAAAQQEATEQQKWKHHNKLHHAKHAEAASMAQDILQGPAGFAHFTERLLRLYKQHGIEWPTVVLEYKDVNVTTKVCREFSGCREHPCRAVLQHITPDI